MTGELDPARAPVVRRARGGRRPQGSRAPAPRVPWALALPVVSTALFLLWWGRRAEDEAQPPFTPTVVEAPSVAGWSGAVDLDLEPGPQRGRLSVRLWPLHPEAGVQAFDAAALARRLDLSRGEPWLAELRWEAPLGQREVASLGGLSVRTLTVVDGAGEALVPLVRAPEPSADAGSDGASGADPSEPLRVLLAPPSSGLGAGQTLSVVLWGRAPHASATEPVGGRGDAPRVAGLVWEDGSPQPALALEPVMHAVAVLPRDLARFEPEGPDTGSAGRAEDGAPTGVR